MNTRTRATAVLAPLLLLAAVLASPGAAGAATTTTTFFNALSTWRYFDTATGAPPAGWQTTGFNDSAWKSGGAELGAGDGGETRVINRNAPSHAVDFFRIKFTVADRTKVQSLDFRMLADDGAVVYLNGTKVLSDNMNSRGTAAATVRDGTAEQTWRQFALPTTALVSGTNSVAVALYQVAASDRDSSFNARLAGQVEAATTTTTSTTTTTWAVPGPDATAQVQAMLDAAPAGSTVTIDQQYTVDGTLVLRQPVTLAFTPTGLFRRVNNWTGTRSKPLLVLGAQASGSRFDSLRVRGPVACDFQWPAGRSTYVAYYDPTLEAQHAVDVQGASNLTFNAPDLAGMHGDGINITGNPSGITVNDATVSCMGRNAVSNTGSTATAVNRGTFSGSGLWNFDVEPFGTTNAVNGFTVTGARVGMSGWPWMNADGPDFNCKVTAAVFKAVDTTGAYPVAPTVNACVASQVSVVA